jgi:hypothetical protein
MLTRVLLGLALIFGSALAAGAEETAVRALGLADHEVSQAEAEKGESLPAPRTDTGGVAYALVAGLKKGDVVDVALVKDDKALMHNTETLAEDEASLLVQAGKRGVPAGGWPEGNYRATVTITRDGKALLEQSSKPIPFE